MRRLLIVDDESRVCERMKELLPWAEFGIDAVETAHNGEQAWELARTGSIDLVLTDIRMPIMSGLELAERMHIHRLETKVIVMSAYTDFTYAQEAIRYGVKGYLLKPVAKADLAELVRSVADEWRRERLPHAPDRTEAALAKLLRGESLDAEERKLLPAAMREGSGDGYVRVVVCAFHQPSELSPLYAALHSFRQAASRLQALRSALAIVYGNRLVLFVFDAHPIGKAELLRPLQELQELFRAGSAGQEAASGGMTFGVGNMHGGAGAVAASFAEAIYALGARFFRGADAVLFRQDLPGSPEAAAPQTADRREDRLRQTTDALALAVADGRSAEASRLTGALFDLLDDSRPERIADIRLRCLDAIFALDRLLQERQATGRFPDKPAAVEAIQMADTLQSLRTLFKRQLEAIAARAEQPFRDQTVNRYVQAAKQYVETNYAGKIMIEDVSSFLHLNMKYFSSLFKKETGENFIDYVNRIRIEKAARLILQSDDKIFQISEQVGFPNLPYFNRMFKKVVGVTPLVFRINRTRGGR
ncbi:response regulator [Paenibacillus cymbidii]|uniref:response regulator n=1 Tax=Paenibacillus cymbidii TaxID=1639034 RepID=UPI001436BFC1|nr:response regulator [Paenibacillus cymbidii]